MKDLGEVQTEKTDDIIREEDWASRAIWEGSKQRASQQWCSSTVLPGFLPGLSLKMNCDPEVQRHQSMGNQVADGLWKRIV